MGDADAATALYQRALAMNAGLEEARLGLIEAQIAAQQYEAAQGGLDAQLARDKKNLRARILDVLITLRQPSSGNLEAAKNQADAIYSTIPAVLRLMF